MSGLVTAWAAWIVRDDDPGPTLRSQDLELSHWVYTVNAWDAVDAWLAAWDIVPPDGVRWERSGRWRFLRSADGGRTPWRFTRTTDQGLWICVVAARDVDPSAVSDLAARS